MSVSPTSLLTNWAAVIALWAPAYVALLDHLGIEFANGPEAIQWALVAVGTLGLASVLYVSWRDTRDPTWRAAHGLAARTRAVAGR
jgi:hypothetical protein